MADNEVIEASDTNDKSTVYAPGPNAFDITPTKDGGVLKEILRSGEGEEGPLTGDTVFVHYVGTLLSDGSKFDSSRDRDDKFEFFLGKGNVIKAWDLGIATMKRGELAMLVCKAEYAYGESGSPPKIPGGATLVFEVELFDWKGEDVSESKDGSITKSCVKEGEGYKQPQEMTSCRVHIVGLVNGRTFQDEELSFVVGEVFDGSIVPGVLQAVRQLKKSEKAKFTIMSKHAYGSEGSSKYNIPPNTDVVYELELLDMDDPKDSWNLSNDEKFSESEQAKQKGTDMFKDERYEVALRYYKRVVELLGAEDTLEGAEAEQRVKLLLASHLNSAMCHLKVNNNEDAIISCNDALKLDAHSEKGLFRRGTAHLNLRNFEEAAADFRAAINVEPTNKLARNNLTQAVNAIKQMQEQEKKMYKGMFAKFAAADEKKEKANEPIKVWKNGDANVSNEENDEGDSEKKLESSSDSKPVSTEQGTVDV